jgi:glycosyltransferase involved in cell wall biosynthesis
MSGSPRLRNLTAPTEVSGMRPTFLLISDEWSPTRGGISRFNRSLATALAAAGYRTICLVAFASASEHVDAAERGVRLIAAERTPAGPMLYMPSEAILSEKPDVVIGHDFVSGSVAWVYARRYLRNAALVHVVHTAPSENEPYKRAGDATRRTEARELEARQVAADADIIAAVGPRLVRSAEAMVGDGFGGVSILQLEPGMTMSAEVADRRRQVPAKPTVLVLGRTAHIQPKGLDIAAYAIAGVTVPYGRPTPELLIRGAPADKCDWLRRQLGLIARLARDRVDVRPFTDDPNQIGHDLRRAALCLMPSRTEGFGLAALEAIELGTPVLVSDKSGVAETLRAHLGFMADQMIVKIVDDFPQDSQRWTEAIQRVLDNLSEAFEYTHEIRSRLGRALSWDATVQSLVTRLAIPVQRADSRSPFG